MQLDLLILIRLTVKATPRSDLRRSLRRFVPAELGDAIDEQLKKLATSGLITNRPLRVTETGRARALEAVRVNAMPGWEDVWRRRLPAVVLGSSANLSDLKAAVLARRLLQAFERPPRTAGSERIDELTTLAGQILHLSATALQLELVRQWVASEPTKPEQPPKPAPRKDWTDAELIAAVHNATARVSAPGRFGTDRIFVSALWKELDEGAGFPGLTLDSFKKRLFEANRTQQLTLARADLVAAMDRREVAASEIRNLNATFHFVIDRSRR